MKLIKIGEEFYLTNKEEIKIGDITLEKDNNGNYYMPAIDKEYQLGDNSGIKVIASTVLLRKKIHLIDLESVKSLTSGFDIQKLIAFQYPKETTSDTSYQYLDGLKYGFKDGFLKVLELNFDKKYTLTELKEAMLYASSHLSSQKGIDAYIESKHQEKSEWDAEIEMRSKNIDELRESKEGFLNNHNLHVPVVECGCINILKIK